MIFDRSWYNRAGVERVMGFCTEEQADAFLRAMPLVERAIVDSGVILLKYWLEVSPDEQTRRLKSRIEDGRKIWKLSPMDLKSYSRWYDYSRARDAMFAATDTELRAVVRRAVRPTSSNVRLNIISHLLSKIPYEELPREKIELPKRQKRRRLRRGRPPAAHRARAVLTTVNGAARAMTTPEPLLKIALLRSVRSRNCIRRGRRIPPTGERDGWFAVVPDRSVAAQGGGGARGRVVGRLAGRLRSGKEADKAKPAAAAPPPPAVVVAEVVQKTVPIYSEFVAQTDARETVEIRARVQAFLEAQHFTEGTIVKKNQLLFTLDKREYEAKLQQAKAELDIALARLGKAETDERRLKPLAERKAVPQQDYDNAAANLLAAQAGVSAARADVDAAELDLSYTTIRSPITGLIGKRLVAPGNLVGKGDATLLDTVSSIDPIRVNATISEAEYLRFFAQAKEQGKSSTAAGADPRRRQHPSVQGQAGHRRSGGGPEDRHAELSAEFPNPDGRLRPGQFGRVRAAVETAKDAILIPKRAVQEIQGMQTVLVVGADNMVALRTIQPGETVGDLLIVRDGLKPGERVIVDGIQKARPGSKVNPTAPPTAARRSAGRAPASQPAAKAGGK